MPVSPEKPPSVATDSAASLDSEIYTSPIGDALDARVPRVAHADGETAVLGMAQPVDGSIPRLVIRGESLQNADGPMATEAYRTRLKNNGFAAVELVPVPKENVPAMAALTDYLEFSFPFSEKQNLLTFLDTFRAHFGENFGTLKETRNGFRGYDHRYNFERGAALFAYGGVRQGGTGYFSIPGEGCGLIDDWSRVHTFLEKVDARITRWDGAVDDLEGRYTVDLAVQWYQAGRFGTGGNKPSMQQRGNWVEPDGKGRTLYIGQREHGKMLRIYEKGKALGDASSPWVRWEVEMRNKNRFIPLDVVLKPGAYVAGAYACMGWVSAEQSRIHILKKEEKISYDALVRCARTAYGPLLNVMRKKEGSAEAVLEKLIRGGQPRRLRTVET